MRDKEVGGTKSRGNVTVRVTGVACNPRLQATLVGRVWCILQRLILRGCCHGRARTGQVCRRATTSHD